MSETQDASIFGRGQTAGATATTDLVELEGREKWFPDLDYSVRGAKPRRSNRMTLCRCVRNVSTIALAPKRLVTVVATAGVPATKVDGYARTTAVRCFPVDEFLPSAGVAVNDLFWIVLRGPATVTTTLNADAGCVIGLNDAVVAETAAASTSTTAGRVEVIDYSGATGSALALQIQNFVGYGLTAKTTSNTGTDLLIDVRPLY